MKIKPSIIIFFLSILLTNVFSGDLALRWDPNQESDVAGYRIYYGSPAGNYSIVIDVGNTTNHIIPNLVEGSVYAFYATCYNTSGLESEPSNIVIYNVPFTLTTNTPPIIIP